jgi:tRNA modification GTPase
VDETAGKFKEKISHNSSDVMIANIRQKEALDKCIKRVQSAVHLIESNAQDMMTAYELKSALGALSEMVGETTSDKILSIIFNKFCVGK